jgi:RimJ/RimL family protein N-acetyltransferase
MMARRVPVEDDLRVSRHWPLHALRISSPTLELRIPDEALLDELLDLARQGIHDPEVMPFAVPWTDTPPDHFVAMFLQYHWRIQSTLGPEQWVLNFVVLRDGRVVGTQGMETVDFPHRRSFDTGSWVGRAYQGQGIGLEMRRAVLTFGFDHLGAEVAHTAALEGNAASEAVTRRIGYEPNGWTILAPRGAPARESRFVLSRERWEQSGARLPITVEGLDACRPLLGA